MASEILLQPRTHTGRGSVSAVPDAAAVVVACIIMFISLAGALLARLLGLRSSLR